MANEDLEGNLCEQPSNLLILNGPCRVLVQAESMVWVCNDANFIALRCKFTGSLPISVDNNVYNLLIHLLTVYFLSSFCYFAIKLVLALSAALTHRGCTIYNILSWYLPSVSWLYFVDVCFCGQKNKYWWVLVSSCILCFSRRQIICNWWLWEPQFFHLTYLLHLQKSYYLCSDFHEAIWSPIMEMSYLWTRKDFSKRRRIMFRQLPNNEMPRKG